MKILVTGGCGFIGSAVVRRAVAAGDHVVNVDCLTYAANPASLGDAADSPNYTFEQVDVCDADALAVVFVRHRPDAVMHLAAESHVDRSIDGPDTFIRTNVVGTTVLLQAARAFWDGAGRPESFRFHQVSTDEVYGSLGDEGLFTEETRYAPNSPYAASKAASDMMARAWGATYGLPVVVSNCSNNYGPCQFPEKLIPVIILNALAGRDIPVYGNGLNVRDWLYVEDHADALLKVLRDGRPGETYNIGGNAEAQNIEIVRKICACLDARRPAAAPHDRLIQFVTDRPGHDFRYAIDAAKIDRELNWRSSMTLDEGLAATVDWYIENTNWLEALQSRDGVGQRLGLSRDQKDSE
ncbi:MAG: dTDP-glucose 4,6-dehydratase [Pseudomonadota bacterium]